MSPKASKIKKLRTPFKHPPTTPNNPLTTPTNNEKTPNTVQKEPHKGGIATSLCPRRGLAERARRGGFDGFGQSPSRSTTTSSVGPQRDPFVGLLWTIFGGFVILFCSNRYLIKRFLGNSPADSDPPTLTNITSASRSTGFITIRACLVVWACLIVCFCLVIRGPRSLRRGSRRVLLQGGS